MSWVEFFRDAVFIDGGREVARLGEESHPYAVSQVQAEVVAARERQSRRRTARRLVVDRPASVVVAAMMDSATFPAREGAAGRHGSEEDGMFEVAHEGDPPICRLVFVARARFAHGLGEVIEVLHELGEPAAVAAEARLRVDELPKSCVQRERSFAAPSTLDVFLSRFRGGDRTCETRRRATVA